MTETAVRDRIDTQGIASEAPAPQLPAVHQEKPPAPRTVAPKEFPAAIAKAIIAVTREIGKIQKDGYNEFQKYKYTRWEDINDKLSPLLSEHGLIIVQSEQSRSLLEENDKGSVLAIVYHFTLINEHGNQWPPVEWTSIARLRDQKGITDDKAAAKCHTQAEKQFCVKQFKIRTDDYDPDDNKHTLPKKDAKDLYKAMEAEIDGAQSEVDLATWGKTNSERLHTLPADWQDILRARYKAAMAALKNAPQETWDEDTGEVDAPADEPDSATITKWADVLETAAVISLYALDAAWSNVPPDIKPILKTAYETRRLTAKPAGRKP